MQRLSLGEKGFPLWGGGHGGRPPYPTNFFENTPIKIDAPHGVLLSLENEALPCEKETPQPSPLPLKSEAPFQIWFLEKILKKSKIVINTCLSVIKQHWRKMAEIPKESDFITWSIQNFVWKMKHLCWFGVINQ